METINKDREKMISAFYKRLTDIYGYRAEQLEKNVSLSAGCDADIAIWRSEKERLQKQLPDVCVIVVCKIEHIRIQADDYIKRFNSSDAGITCFFVAHNQKETRVFYVDDNHGGGIETFGDFPKVNDIADCESIRKFVNRMRNCTKDNLLQAFSKCHNIIRNNDKLSPESAFDEISKVIFIKMLYERKPQYELIYTCETFLRKEAEWKKRHPHGNYMDSLFEDVKNEYLNDGLFEKNDTIRIKRDSFLRILDELGCIGLAGVAEDIKGVAFESFLGKTFRGELGQYFTPRTIVNYMVDVLDVKEGERVCDPCCGSGGFLIRAFEKVQDDIDVDIQEQIRHIGAETNSVDFQKRYSCLMGEFDKSRKNSRYYKLCHNYFYGIDANVRMARTSKMNMIMHGDGHVGVYLHDGLLDAGDIKEGMFDVVLINPPFGVHVERSAKVGEYKTVGDIYELNATNAESLFIERTIKLLKQGGRAGLVLPDGIFNNNNAATRRLRKYVEEHADILNITSIPADVFLASGANIKPSILFIRKRVKEERHGNSIICACKVSDAGINSQGLPSNNRQLQELAPLVRDWIKDGKIPDSQMVRMIDRDDMENWNVQPFFNMAALTFNAGFPLAKLSDVLTQSNRRAVLEDDKLYTRITVKLFNKGIVLRDQAYGKEIGTKKQNWVHTGQFVVSKIDGKSGAFAFLPKDLDGAIVTQDFPVFNVDTDKVLPQYLELVLSYPAMLEQIKATCSGSTGRKRLSVAKFLNTRIPLPGLSAQRRLLNNLEGLQKEKEQIERRMEEEMNIINKTIFEA